MQDVKQLEDIWITIQDYRVNFLIFFMFIVESMPNAGSAFTNFFLGPLKFTDEQYVYRNCWYHLLSWWYLDLQAIFRKTLRVFVLVIMFLSAILQLIPLFIVTTEFDGAYQFWFSIGDEVVVEFVSILVLQC